MVFPVRGEPLATVAGTLRLVISPVVVEVLLFLGFLLEEVIVMTVALLAEIVAFLAAFATEVVATFLAVFLLTKVFLLAFLAVGLVLGHLHNDTTRVAVWVSEAVENHRDEALFHVDVGIVAKEVDTANRDVLRTRDVVDLADDFLRQDVVVLAHAEVEARHGLVLMVAFLLAFLLVFLLVLFAGVEVDGVLVVVEEAVEVECHHAGDEFLAAHPFQLAQDNGQVVVDVLAVDVDMLDAVDVVEELFLADLFAGRDHGFLEGTAHDFLNPLDFSLFAQVDEAEADTAFVGATRAA